MNNPLQSLIKLIFFIPSSCEVKTIFNQKKKKKDKEKEEVETINENIGIFQPMKAFLSPLVYH